jgi:hypothetical protein
MHCTVSSVTPNKPVCNLGSSFSVSTAVTSTRDAWPQTICMATCLVFRDSDVREILRYSAEKNDLPGKHFESHARRFSRTWKNSTLRHLATGRLTPTVGHQVCAGDLAGIDKKRIVTQMPIESQRAFEESKRARSLQASTTPIAELEQSISTPLFGVSRTPIPAGQLALFAIPQTRVSQYTNSHCDSAPNPTRRVAPVNGAATSRSVIGGAPLSGGI